MSRRIALALSLSVTVVVAFAVASFASQAGWLQAKSSDPEVEADKPATTEPSPVGTLEPLIITEYVYEDVAVVVPSSQQVQVPAPTATAAPEPTRTASPPAQVFVLAPDSQTRGVDPGPVRQFVSDDDDDGGDDHDRDDDEHEEDRDDDRDGGGHDERREHEDNDD